MIKLYYIIKKEILEIARDPQSFAMLIVMPAAFILVMSLSMQALFQSHSSFKIKILLIDNDKSNESKKIIEILSKSGNILLIKSGSFSANDDLLKRMKNDDVKFALVINKTFSSYVKDMQKGVELNPLTMLVDPAMQMMTQLLIKNQIEAEVSKLKLGDFFNSKDELLAFAGFDKVKIMKSMEGTIKTTYIYTNRQETVIPTSAQQSVPAWLVFSMYFIVIPISSIFHTEKNNGTFMRLRSINVQSRYLIAGKIFAYYLISMIQVVCMLLIGRYIVPLLGGDSIQFGNSFIGLFAISSAAALNAISYGLFVSSFSKTTQMAGSVGLVFVIIMAAIGGIMVPKFVMPGFLQELSNISPLSWGMEGFLDIMLRNGSVYDILPETLLLTGTALVMLILTGIILKKKNI